ncbi:uncharacterized protein LOC132593058 isoform X2 [Zootoca vivipara]|uniref:uncharacterized protein LOC132593058 isoform X2 n=1 Tax=Zootoca vivipara TaxID=8524 RepID=UPI00293BEDFD|nr:uncharacterized protein LOC132593058 isoform X2 [Zootoca vivipara]
MAEPPSETAGVETGQTGGKAKKKSEKRKRSRKDDSDEGSDGPLPLAGTGGAAVSRAVPGIPMEPWEREILKGVFASVAPSTLSSYKRVWAEFSKFRNKGPSPSPLGPPTEREVMRYVVHLRELGRATKTLNLHTAAISFFSKSLYSTDPCDNFHLRRAMEGWRRLQPPAADPRRPITFDLLCKIHSQLTSLCWSPYEASLFSAAFSLAYFGALRVGEVVCEDHPDGSSRGIRMQDVALSSSVAVVHIRRSKTDQRGLGATIRLPAAGGLGPCPVRDLRHFLYQRPTGTDPLLVHQDSSKLTRSQFTRVLRKALALCGVDPSQFSAHSFRIGAATSAMHLGLSAERIQDIGRWKSNAYRSYLRPTS